MRNERWYSSIQFTDDFTLSLSFHKHLLDVRMTVIMQALGWGLGVQRGAGRHSPYTHAALGRQMKLTVRQSVRALMGATE